MDGLPTEAGGLTTKARLRSPEASYGGQPPAEVGGSEGTRTPVVRRTPRLQRGAIATMRRTQIYRLPPRLKKIKIVSPREF